MMSEPPEPISGDEICPICSKPKNEHNSEETLACSRQLLEMGFVRRCSMCGLTQPAEGICDRCGKCGEKYEFSNE